MGRKELRLCASFSSLIAPGGTSSTRLNSRVGVDIPSLFSELKGAPPRLSRLGAMLAVSLLVTSLYQAEGAPFIPSAL